MSLTTFPIQNPSFLMRFCQWKSPQQLTPLPGT